MSVDTPRTSSSPFTSVAPGRLCLFGEHQDYLNLPVIALSLPLACLIEVSPDEDYYDDDNDAEDRGLVLWLTAPSLPTEAVYEFDNLPPRQTSTRNPDFALAAIYEALDAGWSFPRNQAYECVSTTDLVMQAGCSSSSAFCVAWVHVLATLANQQHLTPLELAEMAHRAEVVHFGAPGGTMDHITSAVGGLLRIGGPGLFDYEVLPERDTIGTWVLAYSGEPKDTMRHLHRCKGQRLELLQNKLHGDWDYKQAELDETEAVLLQATLINRDTEAEAARLWKQMPNDDMPCLGETLGQLMSQHHAALRDGLGLSTPKLEALNEAALKAGAWGFKVVGSGGGGCGVAWTAPDHRAELVQQAMKAAGATQTWIITSALNGGAAILRPSSTSD